MSFFAIFKKNFISKGGPEDAPIPKSLEGEIGYKFKNKALLREALTHPSIDHRISNERHNQRLEFLGDSVLGCIIAKWLFLKYPDVTEGDLSRKKSLLAHGKHLAELGKHISLHQYLMVGKSEKMSSGNFRPSVLEDAFEALIGAIYLDSDYRSVERIVLQWEETFCKTIENQSMGFNPKGQLQEFLQSLPDNPPISYRMIKQHGPDHRKKFEVEVLIASKKISTGKGNSKKKAEEVAAQSALLLLQQAKK
jgi:ribonuclease-3